MEISPLRFAKYGAVFFTVLTGLIAVLCAAGMVQGNPDTLWKYAVSGAVLTFCMFMLLDE